MEKEIQTIEGKKQLQFFDELASVHMLQEDKALYGEVRPETWEQVINEELTFVAEGINAPMRTQFTLKQTSEGLVDDRGTPLMRALDRGVYAAQLEVQRDPRLAFNARRAVLDRLEGQAIEEMMQHDDVNTIVSCSPFAEEAYRAHGAELVESIGMQPKRQLAFFRIYQKLSPTELRVTSLSVDNSDLEVFAGVFNELGVSIPPHTSSDEFIGYRYQDSLDHVNQELLPDRLRFLYDQYLGQKHGREFNAGREKTEEVDVWQFIEAQQDLIEYYKLRLDALTDGEVTVRNKRELTYSFWATLKERLNRGGNALHQPRYVDNEVVHMALLEQEMNISFARVAARHEAIVGCGGKIGIDSDLLELDSANAFGSIFDSGENEATESGAWIWKSGICRVENCPTRPGKTKVGPCSVCKLCQLQFDAGDDPTKRYKSISN